MKNTIFAMIAAVTLGMAGSASALSFDANVTPGVIMGDGIGVGSWTVDSNNGVELGLRAKLRFDASGDPQNLYFSNGDGTYNFDAGVAPTKAAPVGVWSFEWSINSNADGGPGVNLDGLYYELRLDSDPGVGTIFSTFDPINGVNPGVGAVAWDHSIGTNATTSANDLIANSAANYASLIANNNVAQNSWQAHWYIPGFDPTVDGIYTITLAAFDPAGGQAISTTSIDVIVGAGAPIPEPATMTLLGLGLAGLGLRARKRNRA